MLSLISVTRYDTVVSRDMRTHELCAAILKHKQLIIHFLCVLSPISFRVVC